MEKEQLIKLLEESQAELWELSKQADPHYSYGWNETMGKYRQGQANAISAVITTLKTSLDENMGRECLKDIMGY